MTDVFFQFIAVFGGSGNFIGSAGQACAENNDDDLFFTLNDPQDFLTIQGLPIQNYAYDGQGAEHVGNTQTATVPVFQGTINGDPVSVLGFP